MNKKFKYPEGSKSDLGMGYVRIVPYKGTMLIFKEDIFLAAIEDSTASCDLIRHFINEIYRIKKVQNEFIDIGVEE